MSRHSFDPEIADQVGVTAAVIYQNIVWWCEKNAANEKHIHEGRAWTYNSLKAFKELFWYLTENQIRTALKKLEDAGLLLAGNFNEIGYDRTKWYSPSTICEKSPNHLGKNPNGFGENHEPIPDSKPDNKPDTPPDGDLFSANEKTEKEEDTFEIFWESYPHNPKRRDKKSARAKFWAIVQRRAKGLERYATGEELVAAAKAYAATNPDRNFVPGAEVWLNKSRWIGFLDGLDGEHFSEDDLTPSQVSMLSDGLVPPSMKVDGKPTPAARHWLKVYGHGVRA